MKVALIGVGGFGKAHVKQILSLAVAGKVECLAFAETNRALHEESCRSLEAIGAKHFTDYRTMIQSLPGLDFVVIGTPITLHKSMGIFALEHGVNVLLEKPPAATIQDLDEMIAVERRSGKVCAVNFQNMSGTAFRRMTAMIRDGDVGRVESVTAIGIWKRTQAYYERTPWAGALMRNGEYVLDGSVHNALAHLLQNSLIAAGSGDPGAAEPLSVQAELYKGHDIESEDTACIRIETKAGPVVHYYTSLCGDSNRTPYMIVKGSAGEFRWSFRNEFTLTDAAGVPRLYEFGEENLFDNMYGNLMDTLRGDAKLHCPLEACRSFLIAGNAAFVSSRGAHTIPEAHLLIGAEGADVTTEIRDLQPLFESASAQGKLLSEIGVAWAVPASPVDTRGFRRFDGLDGSEQGGLGRN